MSTSTAARSTRHRVERTTATLFLLGGLTFVVGGAIHPHGGANDGSKLEQLHEMLVDPRWYPAHVLILVSLMLFAAAVITLRWSLSLEPGMSTLLGWVAGIAVVATLGGAVHLFAATQSAATGRGERTALVMLFTGVETIINPLWGLAFATLAVVGGLTGILGNRILMVLGLLGGLAWAIANATIAFTDLFDPLFPVGFLLFIWAIGSGVIGLRRS